MIPLLIWGAAGHAKVLREFARTNGYDLIVLFDNQQVAAPFEDLPLHVGKEAFIRWHQSEARPGLSAAVAIGGARGRDRLELQAFLAAHGVDIVQLVHPTAFVAADARIGAGCQILAHAIVAASASMGDACIVNTKASIDHECELGSGVHIAPGATLAGCVTVGDFSFIGTGAVVLPRIRIGSNAVVGAGSVVTRDVADNAVVYGNPARFRRPNP